MMSFVLDPPSLVVLGILLYLAGKKFDLSKKIIWAAALIIIAAFVAVSFALYMDVIRWWLPGIMDMQGSAWMFHSNITGISKSDVPIEVVVGMFLLYPFWLYIGYIIAQYSTKILKISRKTYSYEDVNNRREKSRSEVVVCRDPDSRKCVRDAISKLGGIGRFIKKGDAVIIKANISGGNPEKRGSFTSIEVVEEVVKLVKEAGGKPCVVDADMVWTEFWPVASAQGWKKWAKINKFCLVNLSETKLAYFNFGRGSALGKTLVSKKMIDANVIISIPTMKTHLLTGVTIGMKNMYGTFPEMDKAKFHTFGIENVIFEINKAFTPNLTIIDGSYGGEAMGPLSSESLDFQTIIASNDVVAADSVACRLMGYEPLEIIHIRKAQEYGLGNVADFDFKDLPYAHPKDGNWNRPDEKVVRFYEEVIEELLKLPGIETFFNLASDFILYDAATLPIFKDITPEAEKVLHDILYFIIQQKKGG